MKTILQYFTKELKVFIIKIKIYKLIIKKIIKNYLENNNNKSGIFTRIRLFYFINFYLTFITLC